MSIWFGTPTLEDLPGRHARTLADRIGIELIELGPDYLRGRMPVDERTVQPHGLLHGGASVALAETIGSVAGSLTVDPATHIVVGQEINANHLRGVRDGFVIGTTRPYHIGKTTQVWAIEIRDEKDRLVCVSRLTLAVVPLRRDP